MKFTRRNRFDVSTPAPISTADGILRRSGLMLPEVVMELESGRLQRGRKIYKNWSLVGQIKEQPVPRTVNAEESVIYIGTTVICRSDAST